MKAEDYTYMSELIKQRSGLALTQDKQYLLESRLQPIARTQGCGDLDGLVRMIRQNPRNEPLVREIVEAMTTNESMFFRDQKPFDQLKNIILPELKEKKQGNKKIRIWSAACSNGQEPYSIAMTLLENQIKMPGFTYDIMATDLDTQVLKKAADGMYTQFEVQRGLPITMLVKYFAQKEGNQWQANLALRSMVTYKPQNLLESFSPLGKYDIIMCRNVLIYFDELTKQDVLRRLAAQLELGGYLILGSTESILGLDTPLKNYGTERGIYVLNT